MTTATIDRPSWFNQFYRLMAAPGICLYLIGAYFSLADQVQPNIEPQLAGGYPLLLRVMGALVISPVTIFLGWLIARKHRANLIGPTMIHWGCTLTPELGRGFLPPVWGALALMYATCVAIPGLALALACFPTGQGATRFWDWWAKGAALLIMAVMAPYNLSFPNAYGLTDPSPLAISALVPYHAVLNGLSGGLLSGFLILSGLLTMYRYRITQPAERKQMRWLLATGVGIALNIAVGTVLQPLIGREMWAQVVPWQVAVFVATPGLGISLAILRHHAWDIDLIIRRTVQWSVVSGLLGVTYFGLITVLQAAFRSISNQQSEISIVLSTLAIAALFGPVRGRVQRFIDRRFFRPRYDAERVLAEFAAHARDETDLAALTGKLAGVIQATMEPERLSVWLRPPAPLAGLEERHP